MPLAITFHAFSVMNTKPAQRATISVAHSASCGYRGKIETRVRVAGDINGSVNVAGLYVAPLGLFLNRRAPLPTAYAVGY